MISILTYREPPSRGSLLNLPPTILDQTLEMGRRVLWFVLPVVTAAMDTPAQNRLKVKPPSNHSYLHPLTSPEATPRANQASRNFPSSRVITVRPSGPLEPQRLEIARTPRFSLCYRCIWLTRNGSLLHHFTCKQSLLQIAP